MIWLQFLTKRDSLINQFNLFTVCHNWKWNRHWIHNAFQLIFFFIPFLYLSVSCFCRNRIEMHFIEPVTQWRHIFSVSHNISQIVLFSAFSCKKWRIHFVSDVCHWNVSIYYTIKCQRILWQQKQKQKIWFISNEFEKWEKCIFDSGEQFCVESIRTLRTLWSRVRMGQKRTYSNNQNYFEIFTDRLSKFQLLRWSFYFPRHFLVNRS